VFVVILINIDYENIQLFVSNNINENNRYNKEGSQDILNKEIQ
jgi:hypothetical protein